MPDSSTALDFYRIVRSRIEHEDNLVTQRLSWLIASQSFFFTAFAVVTGESPAPVRNKLAVLIPIVAALVATLIFCSIVAGVIAKASLRNFYRSQTLPSGDEPPAIEPYTDFTLPLIQGRNLTILLSLMGPLGLPPIFITVWIFLLAITR
jgi:hypothetical protein